MSMYSPLNVVPVKECKKSWLCKLPDYDDEEIFIPFSVMEDESKDLKLDEENEIYVQNWFLKKHELECDSD